MTKRLSHAQQRRRTVNYLHGERVRSIRTTVETILRLSRPYKKLREWCEQLATQLRVESREPCPKCDGHGYHRKREDCDCHDSSNCVHADMVDTRRACPTVLA